MKKLALTGILAALSLPGATINFGCLTDNGNGCASMVGQLTADVTDPGSDQVKFTFNNAGPTASVIAEIYWDDDAGVLFAFATSPFSSVSGGVEFAEGANPPNLPSGQNAVPTFAATFASQAGNPAPQKGINPNEDLSVLFDLSAGLSFDDVLAALESGTLRIGMHVTGIGTPGGSDSVLNEPLEPGEEEPQVPEPSTYALMGAGLLALGALGKRKRNRS